MAVVVVVIAVAVAVAVAVVVVVAGFAVVVVVAAVVVVVAIVAVVVVVVLCFPGLAGSLPLALVMLFAPSCSCFCCSACCWAVAAVPCTFKISNHNTSCPRISEVRKVFEQLASITTSIELRSQKKIIEISSLHSKLERKKNMVSKLAFEHRKPIKLIPPTMRSKIEGSKNSINWRSTFYYY